METKRSQNTMGLKVKFIPATNTQENRVKITQLNNNKSVTIGANMNCQVIDFITAVLNKVEDIKSFSLVVDNSQENYYLFSLDFKTPSFPNIIENFKL